MALSRRAAIQATRQLSRQPQRRFAGHDSHGHHAEVKEGLGAGFWASLAVIPSTYILYLAANSSDKGKEPWLTRVLHKFDYLQEVWKERNDLHAKYVEQSARDRILVLNTDDAAGRRTVPVRNSESLNHHSPYNIPAGWGSINLDKVIKHYDALNAEEERKTKEKYEKLLKE